MTAGISNNIDVRIKIVSLHIYDIGSAHVKLKLGSILILLFNGK